MIVRCRPLAAIGAPVPCIGIIIPPSSIDHLVLHFPAIRIKVPIKADSLSVRTSLSWRLTQTTSTGAAESKTQRCVMAYTIEAATRTHGTPFRSNRTPTGSPHRLPPLMQAPHDAEEPRIHDEGGISRRRCPHNLMSRFISAPVQGYGLKNDIGPRGLERAAAVPQPWLTPRCIPRARPSAQVHR